MTPDWLLYLITDRHLIGDRPLTDVVTDALEGGIRAIQLREKDLPPRALLALASDLRVLTAHYGARLLINHRVDVMLAVDADGVHLRRDSLPLRVVRRLVGRDKLVGVSTHSATEVRGAAADGADFVTFGPIFPTPSKMRYGSPLGLAALEAACRDTRIPVFAIGGIERGRIDAVMSAGAHGAAMISAVMSSRDVRVTARSCGEAVLRAKSSRTVDPRRSGCYN